MARGDCERIADILSAIADIRADTTGMDFVAFHRNPVVVRSVLYSIGVIGEAAKKHQLRIQSCPSGHSLARHRRYAGPDRP